MNISRIKYFGDKETASQKWSLLGPVSGQALSWNKIGLNLLTNLGYKTDNFSVTTNKPPLWCLKLTNKRIPELLLIDVRFYTESYGSNHWWVHAVIVKNSQVSQSVCRRDCKPRHSSKLRYFWKSLNEIKSLSQFALESKELVS